MNRLQQTFGIILSVTALAAFSVAQKRELPCEISSFALAADNSGTWFSCSNAVYWLDSKSAPPVRVAYAERGAYIFSAPRGSRALLSIPQKSAPNSVVLIDRELPLKTLPNGSAVLAWSADGKKVYVDSGPAAEDASTAIAIYDLVTGSSKRQKLLVPTETVRTCASTGHVFTTTPKYPGNKGSTVEYTAELKLIKAVKGWNGARFSATCKYVASESDFHGPLAWEVSETATGKTLHQFADMDERTGEFYSIVEWNPKIDSLMLRKHYNGGAITEEVFDVVTNRIVQSFSEENDLKWSPNGESVVFGNGKKLEWHSVPRQMP